MSGLFSVWSMDLGRGGQRTFDGRLNHRQLHDVGVAYARYGSPVAASLSHGDYYLQGFPVRGHGSYSVDGSERDITRYRGIACGPGADLRIKYTSDFAHLILRIAPQRLVKTLSGLIARPVDPPLKMMPAMAPALEIAAAQYRLLEFVVRELDRPDTPLPGLVLAELEQALVVSYLCSNSHNYSHFLEGQACPVAPWQVRLVEDYIAEHWDQSVTVEALALVANASVRSLFYSFKKSRGMSPMTFVRQIRLQHAKEMLASADPQATVTSVAAACGFSNLGHFAKYYRSAFGEHPSATLKATRG